MDSQREFFLIGGAHPLENGASFDDWGMIVLSDAYFERGWLGGVVGQGGMDDLENGAGVEGEVLRVNLQKTFVQADVGRLIFEGQFELVDTFR